MSGCDIISQTVLEVADTSKITGPTEGAPGPKGRFGFSPGFVASDTVFSPVSFPHPSGLGEAMGGPEGATVPRDVSAPLGSSDPPAAAVTPGASPCRAVTPLFLLGPGGVVGGSTGSSGPAAPTGPLGSVPPVSLVSPGATGGVPPGFASMLGLASAAAVAAVAVRLLSYPLRLSGLRLSSLLLLHGAPFCAFWIGGAGPL